MTKEEAKQFLIEHDEAGWLKFIDSAFHNKPENVEITQVFEKWGALKIRFEGESEYFQRVVDKINQRSAEICEICGENGEETVIGGWVTTLCNLHYNEVSNRQKPSIPPKRETLPSLTREEAKKHISETCGQGWLPLIDSIYDNQPQNVEIKDILEKWGSLEVEYEGENGDFERLAMKICLDSEEICMICGEKGDLKNLDYKDYALCKTHFLAAEAAYKWSAETGTIKKD